LTTLFYVRNIIGKRVRLARKRRKPHLTQEELAAALQLLDWDISRGGIAKIEGGFRQVTDIEVKKLAQALKVSTSWLFEED